VVVEAADERRSGVAVAVYNNVKSFGGSLAGSVMAALMAALPQATGGDRVTPREGAYVPVWLLCAMCAAGASAAALLAHRPGEQGTPKS
jgi:hypothetical protein